ncbi:hypothetical protein [Kribbella jiaozuonensis]|uniref:Uncharacterized protein n=1 Tax=Kribbella jiaozuonensis TaxID=2575441 RepID=A0A4V5UWX4_9ACTN|nr:hypothetical protein [Kribbella jiaozuonensis]TKK77483.1 hypothetical protein FDA38_20165 [Kribbella jiaozuonensis]
MRRSLAVVAGAAVLVCAGCSAEPEKGSAPSAGGTTKTSAPLASTAPKPTPTAVALSVPMYQRALTNVEKTLKPSVARVMNAQTIAAFDASRAVLAKAVVIERGELAKITPPTGLVAAHPAVLDAFDAYAGDVSTELSRAGGTKTGCGFPKALDVRLYEAKSGLRFAYAELAQSVQKSIGRGVKFGAVSVPPKLAQPAVIAGRGENGDVFQRSGPRGSGSLEIKNAGDDVVIVIAGSNPRQPQASIYVRADKTATLNGIRSQDYWVYFKSGTSWDAKNHRFTENCSYQKFDDIFDGSYNWTISLAKTPLGNASSSETESF